jgi:hypothetical protein
MALIMTKRTSGSEWQLTEVGTFSIITIMLRYALALSHKAFILSRIVIASNIYCSENIGPVVTSYSYCSDVIDQRYRIYSFLLLGKIAF